MPHASVSWFETTMKDGNNERFIMVLVAKTPFNASIVDCGSCNGLCFCLSSNKDWDSACMSTAVSSNESLDSKRPVMDGHTGYSVIMIQHCSNRICHTMTAGAKRHKQIKGTLEICRLCLMANEEKPLAPASTRRFIWRFLGWQKET